MRYRSKVDWWIWPVLALPLVVMPAIALYLIASGGEDRDAGLVMLGTWALVMTVVGVLSLPIYYEISGTSVCIRSGVLRNEIAIDSIASVTPTHNPLSAPALSLDRLSIVYDKGGRERYALVSPADRAGFLQELAARDASLRLDGNRLVRSV